MTKPNVVAEAGDGGTVVYVSWNGATEVEAWQVYGGLSRGNLTLAATAKKTTFETEIHVDRTDYVQVKPVFKSLNSKCRPHNATSPSTCRYTSDTASEVVAVVQ